MNDGLLRPPATAGITRAITHRIALRNGEQAMPRGRKSEGEQPLSNAERQARYRRGSRPTGPRPSSATSVQPTGAPAHTLG